MSIVCEDMQRELRQNGRDGLAGHVQRLHDAMVQVVAFFSGGTCVDEADVHIRQARGLWSDPVHGPFLLASLKVALNGQRLRRMSSNAKRGGEVMRHIVAEAIRMLQALLVTHGAQFV
jgi:hypothetical protein